MPRRESAGANTLANLAEEAGGLELPVLGRMGLGHIPRLLPAGRMIEGVPPCDAPNACFGAMREVSVGKDTTTGHWEMAGLRLATGFHVFPPGPPAFPVSLIADLEEKTGRKCIGNKAASGTAIIQELGPRQMRDKCWIVYTSADSVLQIAAHEEIIPLPELYRACEIARGLCDRYMVGRVIARPYVGLPGGFTRTPNRRDFSYPLPGPTILDSIVRSGIQCTAIGKIDDIFNHRGFTQTLHSEANAIAESDLLSLLGQGASGFIFANLIDFDMLYGHRRDAAGYAAALKRADAFLGEMLPFLHTDDLLIITADHGNDPTFTGTDHTREYVPLLVYGRGRGGVNLGIRNGFYDVAQTVASYFGLKPMPLGLSFL